MNRSLLLSCLLLVLHTESTGQCSEPTRNKVLLVGDSWAFFMGVDQTINEVLEKWGHSGSRYYTNLTLAENGAETDDFLGAEKQAEIADQLLNDADIKVVHLSIGGNDVLGDWNVDFTEAQTDSLEQAVFLRLRSVIDFILDVRPDIHVLWSGYMYPNFGEVIEDIAPLQSIHPFYGTWEGMGFPSFEQLNTILNDFSATIEAYTDTMPRVSFVNSPGLMQHTFGQSSSLGVAPGGSYPPLTAPLPQGFLDYPSPKSSMRNYGLTRDCFHLSASGYRDMLDLHAQKFYHKFLMDDQYLLSSGSEDGSVSNTGTVNSSLQLGGQGTEQFATVLTFNTTTMTESVVEAASIFLRRESLVGVNPVNGPLQVKVKSGAFGGNASVEAVDFYAQPDASAEACRFGSTSANGHWIRVDLPAELLVYITPFNNTQFMLSAPGFPEGIVSFSGAADPDFAPVLNLTFGDLSTGVAPVADGPSMTVLPNPTTGPITFDIPDAEILKVEVVDLLGQVVLQRRDQRRTLDLSGLPNGTYVVHVSTDAGSMMQRVVKW